MSKKTWTGVVAALAAVGFGTWFAASSHYSNAMLQEKVDQLSKDKDALTNEPASQTAHPEEKFFPEPPEPATPATTPATPMDPVIPELIGLVFGKQSCPGLNPNRPGGEC